MKSPMPGQFLAQLRPYRRAFDVAPGLGAAMVPLELWMQAAVARQRNMVSAWSMWGSLGNGTPRFAPFATALIDH